MANLNALRNRRGSALIEFSLLGIPVLFITISIVSASLNMWVFHNLAYASEATARYASLHGYNCSQNGNTCTITVGAVAHYFEGQGLALDSSHVSITLTDNSGSTTCAPVSSCESSAAQFPASTANAIGQDVKVKATYTLLNPIAMYWPPDRDGASDFTVGATSRQRIAF